MNYKKTKNSVIYIGITNNVNLNNVDSIFLIENVKIGETNQSSPVYSAYITYSDKIEIIGIVGAEIERISDSIINNGSFIKNAQNMIINDMHSSWTTQYKILAGFVKYDKFILEKKNDVIFYTNDNTITSLCKILKLE